MTNDALRLLHRIIGLTVMCRDHQRVGRVDDIFFSPRTSRPEWIAVRRSQVSRRVTPIPLEHTSVEGLDIRTTYTSLDVRDAPSYRAHVSLTTLDERHLKEYWRGRPRHPSS